MDLPRAEVPRRFRMGLSAFACSFLNGSGRETLGAGATVIFGGGGGGATGGGGGGGIAGDPLDKHIVSSPKGCFSGSPVDQ